MSGDFSVTATAKFLTEGIAHRKAVIMLRKTLGVIPRCLLRKSHVGHVNQHYRTGSVDNAAKMRSAASGAQLFYDPKRSDQQLAGEETPTSPA
jgi:hypothetical protein